eukprot:gene43595-9639_t
MAADVSRGGRVLCDPLCCHAAHPFMHLLRPHERDAIHATASATIAAYWGDDPKGRAKPEASRRRAAATFAAEASPLRDLRDDLAAFLAGAGDGGGFFLRLSSLSPKDAYLFLCADGSGDGEE